MKKIRLFVATILLMAMTVTHRLIVVLNFPDDIDDFITYANAIHQSMSTSSYFSGLSAKLATLLIDIGNLETAHTGVNASPPTVTTAVRDGKLIIVQNGLRGLRLDVQELVYASPTDALTIAEAANMNLQQQGAINKQDFEAKRGDVSGTAKLVAKGRREHCAHEWAMSLDGTNWTYIPTTLVATTEVTGLAKASIWDFRHRYITRDGATDWLYFNDLVIA